MVQEPQPITNRTQIIGVSSPYYITANYLGATWTQVQVKLWIWKGTYEEYPTAPTYVLRKPLVEGQSQLEIDIAPYVKDTINPICKPDQMSTLAFTNSDYSFVYYEIEYLREVNSFTPAVQIVHTQPGVTLLANLGWRYSFEPNAGAQMSNNSIMPNGDIVEEFTTEDSFQAFEKWFKISEAINSTAISYTTRSYPITDSLSGVSYANYSPSSTICTKESYAIFFIGKSGDWQFLPFYGRPQQSVNKTAETYNRGFLNRYTGYNPRNMNSKVEINTAETTTFNLNTGRIPLPLAVYAESILYSPRLILMDYQTMVSYPVKVRGNFNRKNMYDDKNDYNVQMSFELDNSNVKKW